MGEEKEKGDACPLHSGQQIDAIQPGSIAEELGIEAGDVLLSINGERILDRIDYQYLSAEETLCLTIQNQHDGQVVELEIEKDDDESLGLVFDDPLMSPQRCCANACSFCFVDQMRPGLRETLYVKDDDWRMSFLMGNFITLSNVGDKELARIIARRAGPLYISVQATDPAMRQYLLGNRRAGLLMEQLRKIAAAGLQFHAQFVLCHGLNDGAMLEQSLADLYSLGSAVLTAAVVPVGLTQYRKDLAQVEAFDSSAARAVVQTVERWQHRAMSEQHRHFVMASDEFYVLSGQAFPPGDVYEGYPQIENGVGMFRKFMDELEQALKRLPPGSAQGKRFTIATGASAHSFIAEKAAEVTRHSGAHCQVYAIENRFFGPSVTVAGLVVGSDIAQQLAGADIGDALLIVDTMLKENEDVFLDGTTVDQLAMALGAPVRSISGDGASFAWALAGREQDDPDDVDVFFAM